MNKIKNILKNKELNNYDILKNIAFFTMIIDHIGYYFFPYIPLLRAIGRISMLIFSVLHGISCNKQNNNILLFAIITAIMQIYLENTLLPLNILFNFYLSYYITNIIEEYYNKHNFYFYILLLLLLPITIFSGFFFEYGLILSFLMLCGKIFKKDKKTKKDIIITIIIFLLHFIYQYLCFNFNIKCTIITILLYILFYIFIYNFKIKKLNFDNKFLVFISKFSLQLYFIHLLIFIIIHKCLY